MALAFAHFSSELLFTEQMIIPLKKKLNNAGHIDAKLIDFSEIYQTKSSEIGCFLLIVSWRSFPPEIARVILLHEKFLQFDWLRVVVFQLDLKYLHVKITNLLRVVV